MVDGLKRRFLELLNKDLATLRETATAWEELEKHNACLEDLNGRVVASAAEMKETYRRRERELLKWIEKVKTL
jgi:hypothetical protein